MTANEVLTELEAQGTEQARKTYRRHGVDNQVWGVSYADLGKWKKKLKTDHEAALGLWSSDVHDARVLALLVADPQRAEATPLDAWVASLTNYVISDALSGYVAATPLAKKKAEQWIKADHEWTTATGWNVMGSLAAHGSLPDSYFEALLITIERDLHGAKNRVRHSMNMALINIGARNAHLHALAVAAAGRIGKVKVDHGQTGCVTPEAVAYMQKILDRRKK